MQRLLVYGGVWTVLTGGDAASWLVGGPMVLAATAVGLFAFGAEGTGMTLHRLPVFGFYFIHESVRGSIDVAYRALHPKMPIVPGIITTSFGGAHDAERALMTCAANLMPGTLTVDESPDHMVVHVLHVDVSRTEDIAVLHKRVAGMFKFAANSRGPRP